MRCGRKRVVRLMQALGLQAKRHRKHKPPTTSSDPTARFAPNLLNRDFTAPRPNTKWVTDITAIPTAEGWLSPFGGPRSVLSHGRWLGHGFC